MYRLVRISIQNWGLIGAVDIDVRGSTALIGTTAVGKSSVQDAVQTVITGAKRSSLRFSSSVGGLSTRTILGYCLGVTRQQDKGDVRLRDECETILALVFEDTEVGDHLTIGVAISASCGATEEVILSRFITPGYAFSMHDAQRHVGIEATLPWSNVKELIKAKSPEFIEYKSAEKYTDEFLRRMHHAGQAPSSKWFLAAFGHAVAFSPICDPARFVREYILEQDDLDIEGVKASIAAWREIEIVINPTADGKHRERAGAAILKFFSGLGERLTGAQHKLAQINERLAKWPINGRVYALVSRDTDQFQRINDLAREVSSLSGGLATKLDDGGVDDAVAQLESPAANKFVDYREYLDFDIVMTDETGKRTALSERAVKGSAGEAVEPFYVAMAAALSSAYFPEEAPTGMGLVMFDEAFAKLDASSARKLLKLYGDMNLQPIITAPEGRQATFAELVDTVVVVNKMPNGQAAFI